MIFVCHPHGMLVHHSRCLRLSSPVLLPEQTHTLSVSFDLLEIIAPKRHPNYRVFMETRVHICISKCVVPTSVKIGTTFTFQCYRVSRAESLTKRFVQLYDYRQLVNLLETQFV